MQKRFGILFVILLLISVLVIPVSASDSELVPVGKTVNLELALDGVYVVKYDAREAGVPARDAGIKPGDRIVSVNGASLSRSAELKDQVRRCCGEDLILQVLRGEKEMSFTVRPVFDSGAWRIGIFVRDHIAGLGTVTYYDPETGRFGALGHGIAGTGTDFGLDGGITRPAQIESVQKGSCGKPGELQGRPSRDTPIGVIEFTTEHGVFGHAEMDLEAQRIPVADRNEISTGAAELLCNVSGTEVRRYEIEIEGISFGREAGKNLRLHITDPALLEQTGGIVQGMSGSPILQNGKLVGAVTHVLVQDPTRGYGILIENMLEDDLALAG